MSDMAEVDIAFVQVVHDRHGKVRYYFRRRGYQRATLKGEPGSVEFAQSYETALRSARRTAVSKTEGPRSIGALIAEYYQSNDFKPKAPNTKKGYRSVLEQFRRDYGTHDARDFNKTNLNVIFHGMSDTPAQASLLRKRLKAVFATGEALGWVTDNPIIGTKTIRYKVKGFAPWSEADIAAYRNRWPSGTKQRRAMELLLNTAVRRCDAHVLGRQHLVGANGISVVQEKTDERVTIPIHPDLARELAYTTDLTFVLTEFGKPYTEKGFSNWMVDNAVAAGLKDRTPHGLRKAAGRRLAEAGCSEEQIAAVLGHSDPGTAKIYTKDANQARMANDGMTKLLEAEKRTKA